MSLFAKNLLKLFRVASYQDKMILCFMGQNGKSMLESPWRDQHVRHGRGEEAEIKAKFSETVINHNRECRSRLLDSRGSRQIMQNWIISWKPEKYHLTTWRCASSAFCAISEKNIQKPRLKRNETAKKSHYSFPSCHSDDSLSAALLSSSIPSSECRSWRTSLCKFSSFARVGKLRSL